MTELKMKLNVSYCVFVQQFVSLLDTFCIVCLKILYPSQYIYLIPLNRSQQYFV